MGRMPDGAMREMTMRAIRFSQIGGPEVMQPVDLPEPMPGPLEVRIRHAAIGVNFIDTYHRSGLYPLPLPSGLGLEGVGVVDAVGEGVTRFALGDRAAYCTGPIGAYAAAHCVAQDRALHVPEGISDEIAAACLLKGMTARYLLHKTFPVKPGDFIVLYAAAGGVGQICAQWARHIGAIVIAIVGSAHKAALAISLGCAHALIQGVDDIPARVREITGGEGAAVVYDSVGRDTFAQSLDCLAPLGMLVSFGNASGPVGEFSPALLSQKGSLFLTRPTLFHYTRTPALLQETGDALFAVLASGAVQITPPARYALADAAEAHRDLESRAITGSVILVP